MSKLVTAAALVILGLGIGLWIGFNPEAHAAAQEKMDRASQAFAQVRVDAEHLVGRRSLPGLRPVKRNGSRSNRPATDNSSEGLDLQEIWSATQRVWISLLSRISTKS